MMPMYHLNCRTNGAAVCRKFYNLLAKLFPQPVPVVVQIVGSGAHFSLRLSHYLNACDGCDMKIEEGPVL